MNIEKITIQNFRNIEEPRTFYFNPNFTAIIGINGKGKSTILSALRIAAGTYFLAIPDVKKWHIQPDEIRKNNVGHKLHLVSQRPVLVEATGTLPEIKESIVWRRQILENSNSTTSKASDVAKIRQIGRIKYAMVKSGEDKIGLPVIAFFGTSRAHGAGRNRKTRTDREIFIEGYHSWFEMKSTTYKYENWLSSYDVLLKIGKEYQGTEQSFLNALKSANPYINEIENVNGKIWLKVNIEGTTSDFLPIDLHSDGICSYTEMVAELAYRCIVLNGYLGKNAIEESRGIVMIDELDLHLHPNWQRHVVNDLKKAFPKIQFVVTTHSPFIVQSLKSDEIWNLDKVMDVTPKDFSIDEVATQIMGVKSAYSSENEKNYEASKQFLDKLNRNTLSEELEKELDNISDPAVRAFLELNKMAKGK